MGADGSKPVDGWDGLQELGIVPGHSRLSPEEAERCWNSGPKKADPNNAIATRDEMKEIFSEVAKIFAANLEAENKAKFEEKEAALVKPKEKQKFTKWREQFRLGLHEQFGSQKTVTYFCRAAKASEKGCPKDAFITTITTGGKLARRDEFRWDNFNKAPETHKLTEEEKQKIREQQANQRAEDEKKMNKTDRAQEQLLRQKQALFARDEKDERADKAAKELRYALAERTKEIFKKCSEDGKSLKPNELRSLVQMWYIPTEEEVNGFMTQGAIADASATGVSADTYIQALVSAVGGDVKLDAKFEQGLRAQFESQTTTESKTLGIPALRELVKQTYLAPKPVVDEFCKILDQDGNGTVLVTEILDSHSDLEKAFPDLFRRLKAQEEARIRQQAEEGLALAAPSKKKEEPKKIVTPATSTSTPPPAATTDAPAAQT